MVYYTVAWTGAPGIVAALTNINATADPVVFTAGVNLTSPGNQLFGVYAVGASLTRVQLTSPTLRKYAPLEVEPYDVAAVPATPPAFNSYFDHPAPLGSGEIVNAAITQTVANQATVVAWIGDKVEPAPAGPIFTTRATGTTTLVVNAWTNVTLTYDQSLEITDYAIVGIRARSTNAIAARLVFPKQPQRPGVIAQGGVGRLDDLEFRTRSPNLLGTFNAAQPPSVDFLAGVADAAETVIFDLVKLGGK